MVVSRVRSAIVSAMALGLLASCAGSPLGETVERSLEADPQLEESPAFSSSTETSEPEETPEEVTAWANIPEPGEPDFIGPLWSDTISSLPSTTESGEAAHSSELDSLNLEGVPTDFQTYIQDLYGLNLLQIDDSDTQETANKETDNSQETNNSQETAASPFNQVITRQEYAQWLFETYNALYGDEPGERLRSGAVTDEPVFQDVPTTAPNFAAIQGLAAAGIIPSALTGNSTAVNFRPDAPLARADLILWKIPLDTRSALPTTSPETVTEMWGFQDASGIEPQALRAIAADFQLGDFSNIRRAFGYTTLFRPDKAVTRAEAAAAIWRFGSETTGRSAAQVLLSDESTGDSD
ncbi:MAG: S-layer homology domain-containing protein [Leptolyngbya sp. SIO1D8]|nr:S-layer homology domain-containing protein [Leptolyngbya sp. SIO1D8]